LKGLKNRSCNIDEGTAHFFERFVLHKVKQQAQGFTQGWRIQTGETLLDSRDELRSLTQELHRDYACGQNSHNQKLIKKAGAYDKKTS
jgi:NAD(P)H-flavin reductase